MKIDLRIYLAKNLGDDLFLEIVSDRYRNVNFITYPTLKYNAKELNENIIMRSNIVERKLNYIFNKLRLYIFNTNKFISKNADATIIVGGSIFQEGERWHIFKKKLDLFANLNKKYYILGCNFGPYISQEFYNIHKKIISGASDVCFRDKKSYDLFKDLNNVRYAPDIVFSLNEKKYKTSVEKKIIISVIDLSWRNSLKKYTDSYENKILEIINYFYKNNYKITLMSFSKFEGDELAIERIIEKTSKEKKKNIKKFFYTGDIKSALMEISSSELIVASRFHANVLGLVFNKTIIPIIYSEKTENLLNDIDFKGRKTTIKNINNFDVEFTDKELNYKVNIELQKKLSNKQFLELDKILKKGD